MVDPNTLARNGGYRSAVILLRRGESPKKVEQWLMRQHCIDDVLCAHSVVRMAIKGIEAADRLADRKAGVTIGRVPNLSGRIK